MILTNEQLRATLRGALETKEENGHVAPYRFGAHLRDEVYPVGNQFHPATSHTSGIVSTFNTNSEMLSFSWELTEASEDQSFDVWANGIFLSHTVTKAQSGRTEVELPGGEKTVTIYFPYRRAGRIFDVTIDDGASFSEAPKAAHKLLFIGDSITHGSTTAFASMTYAHQIARALDAEIVNQGIGGEGFNPHAVDLDLYFEPDLISVSYGTNDWSHNPSHAHFVGVVNGHLAALRDRYPTTPIVMILPIWRADYTLTTKKVGSFEDARIALREAAERFGITVVDGFTLVPHLRSVMDDDRLHPNAFGFQFYAENLLPHFEKILGK